MKRVPGSELVPISVKSNIGYLDTAGREIVDGRPMQPPLGYKKTPSISEQIRDMVRSESLRQAAIAAGAETFEESDDFDVDDDYDPSSPFEEYFDPGSVREYREAIERQNAEEAPAGSPLSTPYRQAPEAPKEPETAPSPPSKGDGG